MAILETGPIDGPVVTTGADNQFFATGLAPTALHTRAEAAASIAAEHAEEVDREARFPEEAIGAVRAQRLLGVMVPQELGGEDASLAQVIDICFRLAQACSSTAMIYAMHQIKVACIMRHRRNVAWHGHLLRRLCSEQLLLASSTTEGRGGGNVRSSEAPIE